MTIPEAILALGLIYAAPVAYLLLTTKGSIQMAVDTAVAASLAEMQTSIAAIPAMVTTAVAAAETAAAQDKADTAAAVQTTADALKSAVGA